MLSLIIGLLSAATVYSQETAFYNNTFENYIQGKSYFEQELYGQAIEELEVFLNEHRLLPDAEFDAIYDMESRSRCQDEL